MKVKTILSIITLALISMLFCACPEPKPTPPPPPPVEIADSLKTGLPILFIHTENEAPIVSKENYLSATIYMVNMDNPDNPTITLNTTTDIRGRGNDTWTLPKKPYRLKFHEKQSLFGLPEAKNWILLANDRDYTLLLTSVAFELGRRFELPYTHHTFPVEVVLNGKHLGSYVLTENKEVGKGRVDIDKNEGWFVEVDTYWDEDPKFKSNILKLPFMISSPEGLPDSGYDFVKNDINNFEAKLFDANYPNNDFMDLMNVNTFIDYIMINEIVQNREIFHPKSMYWNKDKGNDAKISLGPLWDFDWAFGFNLGMEKYFIGHSVLIFADHQEGTLIGEKLLSKLFESPELKKLYKQRWNEMKPVILSMTNYIDTQAKMVQESQKRNAKIWGWKGNKQDYMEEIALMKQWWINRVNFLDSKIQTY